jgi:drug/metabolite transporter (DMT)-like permease
MIGSGVRYMLLATFFFALMNASVKLLPHLPATEIALLRSVVSLALAFTLLRLNRIPLPGNNVNSLLLRGLFGSGSLVLYFITLQQMPLASAVTIQYLSPIFTAILGIFMVRESVKTIQWLFFLISFAGILIVQGFDSRIEPLYLMFGIGSALFAGLAYNTIRQLKQTEHPLIITFYFPLVSIPITLIVNGFSWVMPNGWDWLVLIFIGLTAQTAQYFMTKSYQADDLSKVASLKYLGVIYAWGFGFFLFDETFSVMAYAGMILVIVGVVLNIWFRYRSDLALPKPVK